MITLFKEITTESALTEIEAESEKWDGLYCDLEVAEERKFVKEKAASINTLLKKVNTSRIALTKDYRFNVETEAKIITARLEEANKPFTLLLDKYQVKRNKMLAAKKAHEEAEELTLEIERCHDEAFTLDKLMVLEAKERAQAKIEEAVRVELEIKAREEQAAEDAKRIELSKQAHKKAMGDAAKLKAESDRNNVSNVRGFIKNHLINDIGLDSETAVRVVKSLLKIQNKVTINYL